MDYLVMDTHQRLLGTLRRTSPLNVGDTFTSGNLTYAVVNIEWRPDQSNLKRLMVIPLQKPVAAPVPSETP
ncbi:hypothetical protein [Anthocerotibacter panamensis]|uniref:hypothetical protein n=1 Tax=Anthocerotibacter panamensis TaxID=2857077 RepID=UPI001C40680A|nr:hypothetical protein [Anthocerotibacter panamensis]